MTVDKDTILRYLTHNRTAGPECTDSEIVSRSYEKAGYGDVTTNSAWTGGSIEIEYDRPCHEPLKGMNKVCCT